MHLDTLIIAWSFFHLTGLTHTLSEPVAIDVDCLLDDDGTNPQLSRCLDMGEVFLRNYTHHLKKKKNKQNFDKCGEFRKFQKYLEPMLDKCPAIRYQVQRDWKPVMDLLQCYCDDSEVCRRTLDCVESQMKGPFIQRCDDFYKFNLKQRTKSRCFFLKENIYCKEALISSACGQQSGHFSFHLSKLLEQHHIRKSSCFVSRESTYKGFRYSNKCPADLAQELQQCSNPLLNEQLLFYQDNDLVVKTSKKDIRKSCRVLKEFRHCTSSLRRNCPEGLQMIVNYNATLRTYLLKLEFICDKARKGYMEHLQCFQRVVQNTTLRHCDHIEAELNPLLETTTAQQFYCLPKSQTTIHLRKSLDHLRSCYAVVFLNSCGEQASHIMSEIIKRAFEDPLYLRLRKRPDCSLHSSPPKETKKKNVPIQTVHLITEPTSRHYRDEETLQKENMSHGQLETDSDHPTRSGASSSNSSLGYLVCMWLIVLTVRQTQIHPFQTHR